MGVEGESYRVGTRGPLSPPSRSVDDEALVRAIAALRDGAKAFAVAA